MTQTYSDYVGPVALNVSSSTLNEFSTFRSRCDSHVFNAWLSVSEVQEWVQALAKAAWDLCQARVSPVFPVKKPVFLPDVFQ
jgi:hypothetical protein